MLTELMQIALSAAWKYQIYTYPNPAVGACLVKNGVVVAVGVHKKAGGAHAEVLALKNGFLALSAAKDACAKLSCLENSQDIHLFLMQYHNNIFTDCELFVTLEPCAHYGKTPPCCELIAGVKIKKVYIGSLDTNKQASGGVLFLQQNNVEVEIGILKDECDDLLIPFKKWQQGRFVFFKLAATLNGGTIGNITQDAAKDEVHKYRGIADLLVTGGQTVRIDRPILDARRAGLPSPELFIYSRQQNFDKTIECFNVKDRNVIISDDLETTLKDKKLVMIEGGINLLQSVYDYCDAILLFQAPRFSEDGCKLNLDLRLANLRKVGNDSLLWLYKE